MKARNILRVNQRWCAGSRDGEPNDERVDAIIWGGFG